MIEKYIDRQYEYLMGLDEEEKPRRRFPYWIIAAIVMAIAIIYFSSCNSQKHITDVRNMVDSSYIKKVLDSVRLLKNTSQRLEQTINEMQYAGVAFDTVFAAGKNDTVTNTVVITKEGDITATGKILSAYVSKSVLTKIVNQKEQLIDSLSVALEREKKNVKIETQVKTVDKVVRTRFPWLWLLVSFVTGGIFLPRIWEKIKSFFVYWNILKFKK